MSRYSWLFALAALCVARAAHAQSLGIVVAVSDMVVTSVAPGSPAARGGIQLGDRILQAGGHAVSTPAELTRAAAAATGRLVVRVQRGARTLEGPIVLPAQPRPVPQAITKDVAAAGDGLPPGRYDCHAWAEYEGHSVARRVLVTDAQSYVFYTLNDREKIPGRYRLDAAAGHVAWLSGPLVGHRGEWAYDAVARGRELTIYEGNAPTAFLCRRSASAAP